MVVRDGFRDGWEVWLGGRVVLTVVWLCGCGFWGGGGR